MEPLIPSHSVGPQPLSGPDSALGALGAGGVGAGSILQCPGTMSTLGMGRGAPVGGSCGTSVVFGILVSLGALFGQKQRWRKIRS